MHSYDTNLETFPDNVIEASMKGPVMVDFWAPWCGPCQSLMPILDKLADEYQGAFKLAKVNIDEQQQLAQQFAVRSVPTVKIVSQGQIVDEFSGAIPESDIRAMLSKYIVRESDALMATALQAYQKGDENALPSMVEIINADPANHHIRLQYVDVLVNEGQIDDARKILQSLPEDVQQQAEVSGLMSRLDVMAKAAEYGDIQTYIDKVVANPDDCEAHHQLSVVYIAHGQFQEALEQLLEIMRRDRQFNDDIGRKDMLKVFDMLGNTGELVSYYRKQMASLLN